jgi:branched-chain amino acid transport system substrate-binding protein
MRLDRRTLLQAAAAAPLAAAAAGPRAARAQGAGNTIRIGVLNDQSGMYRDIWA